MTGVVQFYDCKRGFGFIMGDNGEDYFYHISDVFDGKIPHNNQLCIFDTFPTAKGVRAINIEVEND